MSLRYLCAVCANNRGSTDRTGPAVSLLPPQPQKSGHDQVSPRDSLIPGAAVGPVMASSNYCGLSCPHSGSKGCVLGSEPGASLGMAGCSPSMGDLRTEQPPELAPIFCSEQGTPVHPQSFPSAPCSPAAGQRRREASAGGCLVPWCQGRLLG